MKLLKIIYIVVLLASLSINAKASDPRDKDKKQSLTSSVNKKCNEGDTQTKNEERKLSKNELLEYLKSEREKNRINEDYKNETIGNDIL